MTATYGKLDHQSLVLADGLNLILAGGRTLIRLPVARGPEPLRSVPGQAGLSGNSGPGFVGPGSEQGEESDQQRHAEIDQDTVHHRYKYKIFSRISGNDR